MINRKLDAWLDVEDVGCGVDDMMTTECLRSFVQRGLTVGREKCRGRPTIQTAQGCGPQVTWDA